MNESLNEKQKKILLLEEEIKGLEKKKKQLEKLKYSYYSEYFNQSDNTLPLTNIPSNPTTEKHILYNYSLLNVDEVGKMICTLFKRYENKNVVAKRLQEYDRWENYFGRYPVHLPILVIGNPDEIHYQKENSNNIVIDYAHYADLKKYPTDKPVTWDLNYSSGPFERSNYKIFIDSSGDLAFDYHDYEFIKELIYSLAYYQKTRDITWMDAKDTRAAFRKIYKK